MPDGAIDPNLLDGSAAVPELTAEQLAIVTALGERRTVTTGEVLFSPADDHYDFVVMLTATVDVIGPDGEVSLVTRQRPYLTTRVAASGDVIVVPADTFRAHVLTDPRLSDTVLEAFRPCSTRRTSRACSGSTSRCSGCTTRTPRASPSARISAPSFTSTSRGTAWASPGCARW